MPNLNRVMLMGNITRDIELKFTPKGTAIASFAIAINRNYTLEGGEKREEVTFIDLEAFARTAEVIGEFFKKGKPIYVEGRLKLDTWEDKTSGQKRSRLKVIVDSFEFIGGKQDGEQQEQREPQSKPPAQRKPPTDPDLDADDYSGIPF